MINKRFLLRNKNLIMPGYGLQFNHWASLGRASTRNCVFKVQVRVPYEEGEWLLLSLLLGAILI